MPVYGTANFSKYPNLIRDSISSEASFDLSNFYGYNYKYLLANGFKAEIIKIHPSAWFYSRAKYLWRLCSLINNLCRHLKIYKPKSILLKEITEAAKINSNAFIALHDFSSSKYMSHAEIINFIDCILEQNINKSTLLVCETDEAGCFKYEDFHLEYFALPVYCFGKNNFFGENRILNFFKK